MLNAFIMIKLKPGASRKTHLLLAAFIWAAVGLMLLDRGSGWLLEANGAVWLAPALLAGTAKSFLLLDRVAGKNIVRIQRFADNSCLGGVYSLRSWGLVLAMIVLGRLLRSVGLPLALVGGLYVAIGWALFFSSRRIWRAWHELGRHTVV
ncbi:MAG: hypothetical protein AUK28_04850 [Desulfobacterales bacterium CG2_30_60_27]|nr:MAG: hypothetical protein AUK28_04850 [Desulfobacterales bacterium CG2_30_60_27]